MLFTISAGRLLPTNEDIEKVVICAMGGSSLPADIVNNICYDKVQITICRHYDIPKWVDKSTLVFVASHSGNTEETLSALEQVKKVTKNIVICTADGKLLEKAQQYNIPYFLMGEGQPRMMTNYFATYMLYVLYRYGLIEDYRKQLLDLEEYLLNLSLDETARDIVNEIGDKLPMIYASTQFSSTARIWKIKFNENSKTQAFWYEFPELNHNEMVGFTNLRTDPIFLILKSNFDHPRIQKRMYIFEELLKDKASFVSIDIQADTIINHIFGTLLLGDWVSYYLAVSTEMDPTPVDMVENFKELMKDEI